MYVYKARKWFGKIEIRKYQIFKETEKQYKLTNGDRVNKSMIGCHDSVGCYYALDKEEAVCILKRGIKQQIESRKKQIIELEKVLEWEIVEV